MEFGETFAATAVPLSDSAAVGGSPVPSNAGPAFSSIHPVAQSWAAAATRAAETISTDFTSFFSSPFDAVGASGHVSSVFGSFVHAAAASSPAAATRWVVQEIEQGVNVIVHEAEQLFAGSGLEHAAVVDALAAVFAAGVFSAWWLDGATEEPVAATKPEKRAFCDRFIRFGGAAG